MSRSTFKILFYVKKGSERANGYLPLMCRLTVDGEIKQFSCKLDVPPKLWDVKTARATGKSAEAQKINAAVEHTTATVPYTGTFASSSRKYTAVTTSP